MSDENKKSVFTSLSSGTLTLSGDLTAEVKTTDITTKFNKDETLYTEISKDISEMISGTITSSQSNLQANPPYQIIFIKDVHIEKTEKTINVNGHHNTTFLDSISKNISKTDILTEIINKNEEASQDLKDSLHQLVTELKISNEAKNKDKSRELIGKITSLSLKCISLYNQISPLLPLCI